MDDHEISIEDDELDSEDDILITSAIVGVDEGVSQGENEAERKSGKCTEPCVFDASLNRAGVSLDSVSTIFSFLQRDFLCTFSNSEPKQSKVVWNEAQRAKVYHWYKMAREAMPSKRLQFVQEMWKREYQSSDTGDGITTNDTTSCKNGVGKICPSRNTITKLIKSYDDNRNYVDNRVSNRGRNGTNPELVARIEAKFAEMKANKQEITLRPIAAEFGVGKSTVQRIRKEWMYKSRKAKKRSSTE